MLVFVVIATLWCSIICLSRLYLGMHTILVSSRRNNASINYSRSYCYYSCSFWQDLLTGLALTCLLIGPILQHLDNVDRLLIHSRWTPFLLIAVISIAGAFYPEPRRGSPSRGDTCTIIAGAAGVYLGAWALYQQSILLDPYTRPLSPSSTSSSSTSSYLFLFLRSILGLAMMALSRQTGKTIGRLCIKAFYNIDPSSEEHRYKRSVEVPIKLITYTTVGFFLAYNTAIFNIFNIGRQNVYYEAWKNRFFVQKNLPQVSFQNWNTNNFFLEFKHNFYQEIFQNAQSKEKKSRQKKKKKLL